MDSDEVLKAQLAKAIAECEHLREENARLRLRVGDSPEVGHQPVERPSPNGDERPHASAIVTLDSRPEVKVSLFKDLFRGRDDVYAVRWEGRNGKTGYSPAGDKEWDQAPSPGRGPKKSFRITKLFSLSEEVIRDHLLGNQTIGVYPLLQDDTCWFVVVDFDKKSWEADAYAFLKMCHEFGLPASLERSRSGNGGHIWIFFASPVQAALARKLASAILTRTMERRYAVGLDSYDRLFPSQDIRPKGGFGNLIALPLQHGPRESGNSVFVDNHMRPYDDQWAFLSSIKRLTPNEVQALARKVYPANDVINVRHGETDYDGSGAPWILPPSGRIAENFITEPLPPNISVNLGNLIYVEKKDLPDVFLDRLMRLAAFQNPEFYRAQAMRLSTFGKPRVISCAEDLLHQIALPRGSVKEVLDLFGSHRIAVKLTDHRFSGVPVEVAFNGDRRPTQIEAAKALAAYDEGVLCAPTAFGKTAIAANLIALRKVNTLVLVHRRQLMDQWRERLALFLGLAIKDIGQIGGGKNTQTGRLDVAVIQSLIRKGEVKDIVAEYGHVIVDECHHVSAFSFERVLKKVKAKYVVGLTATPVRKDGHHPIILMQCGPIRFNVSNKKQAAASAFQYEVIPRLTEFTVPPEWNDLGIQEIYTALVHDDQRSDLIVADVVAAIEDGRVTLRFVEHGA